MSQVNKVAVIIRVYNRIVDLEYNLDIIRKTWNHFEYNVIVSSNGDCDGYKLSRIISEKADKIVKCKNNQGHLSGNSTLLLQAISSIPIDCKYTILLEADTWIYQDILIDKYIRVLEEQEAVWASAKWYDKCYSLATDFAIVKTEFLIDNSSLLDFGNFPEIYVANFLIDAKKKYIYIRENMMPNLPSYIHKYPFAPQGRFFVFPSSKMVTHHIELLKNGIADKIKDFNAISNNFFADSKINYPTLKKGLIYLCFYFSYLLPRRTWLFKTEKYRE